MTSPNCRLFLVAPGARDAGLLAECLSAAMAAGDIASVLITGSDAADIRITASRFLPLAHAGDVAVLLENNCDLARDIGADGIEIDSGPAEFKANRAVLGSDAIIGCHCATDRHLAMELAEAGADYVRISATEKGPADEFLLHWWSQLFEVPCVTAEPLDSSAIAAAVSMGADFVRPRDEMWVSPAAAEQTIAAAMQAISDNNR